MARVEQPALRGSALGRLLRVWNPFMKRLLRSRLHWPWSRWFALIEWTGRRSAITYRTPVSYVTDGDHVLITTGDAWWRNLVGGGPMKIWLAGRERPAMGEAILDEEELVRLHDRMFAIRPRFARLSGLPRSPDRPTLLRSIRAGRGMVVVRPS